MAQVVLGITLQFAVVQIAKALPGAAGGWLWKKGLDALDPNTDTAKIRADIKALSDQVKRVQDSIDQVAKQLNNVLLELRKDHLSSYANKITARYDAIIFALEDFLNMPKDWTREKKIQKLEDVKKQIENVLHTCVNELPVCMEEIHSLLNADDSSSILQLAKSKSMDGSTDFLSYYAKMQAFIVPFWVAQSKALSLLQMAVDSPAVQYAGGEAAIAKYKGYTEKQQPTYEKILGYPVLKLAQAVLKLSDNSPTINITFKTDINRWVKPVSVPGVMHMGETESPHPWFLKATFPIQSIVPSGSYSFELITPQPEDPRWATTECSWGGYGACMGWNDDHPSWYIKPASQGDRFLFAFTNTAMPADQKGTYKKYCGKYLARQEGLWALKSTDGIDNSNTRQHFTVELA
ncbi:hypothetical protein TWF481_011515 [Arthrobotrys musiformis]|uniref:Uncharacterized protein n=1 Tax=Arthrobotrys musiformis TaxID=47236 RepID=A0AAV9VYS0_9PEZI